MANYCTVEFNKITNETERAYQVINGSEPVWIPKSVSYLKDANMAIFGIARWFADKNGFKILKNKRKDLDISEIIKDLTLTIDKNITYNNKIQQQEAYDKLFNLKRFSLLMECRSGKTKVAIDIACNHFKNNTITNILWLCPLSVINTAKNEWIKHGWQSIPIKYYGIESISGVSAINFKKIAELVNDKTMLVIDECHMIKNFFSVRSKRISTTIDKCAVIGELTGSFITRSIEDIYNQIRLLDWRILGYKTLYQFRSNHVEYSDKIAGLITKTYDIDYLINRIKPFSYEYNSPKNSNVIFLRNEINLTEEQEKYYRIIKNNFLRRLMDYQNNSSDVYLLFTALQSVVSGYITKRLAKHVGIDTDSDIELDTEKYHKINSLANELNGNKIIWCTRRFEVKKLNEIIKTPYIVHGGIKKNERHRIINNFNNSKNSVLIAIDQVARRGIDIKSADTCIFMSRSFDYERREQAIARMYGINKENKTAIDVVTTNSIDERILLSYSRKESLISKFINLLKSDKNIAIDEIGKL